MLEVRNLNVAYGQSEVLHGVNFAVAPGEIVAIVGRNGMGKSTLMKSLIGVMPARSGQVLIDGTEVTNLPSHARVKRGLSYVPQGRQIFGTLSVRENIETGRVVTGKNDIPERNLHPVSDIARVREPARRQSFRGPAAAARDRPGAGERSEDPPARRADRRHSAVGHQGHCAAAQGDPIVAQSVHRGLRAGPELHPRCRRPHPRH